MALTDPSYDIDMTGLENLFSGVVAYVEVRSDTNDISNEIAREMRQMGAIVSNKRDKTITHVIFREGTLRTSNWAKKHHIPLVSVGWLASSARCKLKFLCSPWREPYLEEEVDVFGITKRRRYKRYCKWMNAEEFEADMNRSAERVKKKLDRSINKSGSDDKQKKGEYERLRAITDPSLPPRPRTPEFVRKYLRRQERLKQGGRYSWESSEEDKDTVTDVSDGSVEEVIPQMQEELPMTAETHTDTHRIDKTQDLSNPSPHRRSLFSDNKGEGTYVLIEPISKIMTHGKHSKNKMSILSRVMPKPVMKKVGTTNNDKEKKKTNNNKRKETSAEREISDTSLLNLSITIPKTKTKMEQRSSIDISSRHRQDTHSNESLKAHPLIKIQSLSPLITNKPSASSTPLKNNFVTPRNNKRASLRTRLLKNTAKKRYRESSRDSTFSDRSVDTAVERVVLVPETEFIDRIHRRYSGRRQSSLGSDMMREMEIVPETPLQSPHVVPPEHNDSLMTSALLGTIFDTPNVSRTLDGMLPNRTKDNENSNSVSTIALQTYTQSFIPKQSLDQYKISFTPCFKQQIRNAIGTFTQPSEKAILELLTSQSPILVHEPQKKNKLINVRRSNRLSIRNTIIEDNNSFNPTQDTFDIFTAPLELCTTYISPMKYVTLMEDKKKKEGVTMGKEEETMGKEEETRKKEEVTCNKEEDKKKKEEETIKEKEDKREKQEENKKKEEVTRGKEEETRKKKQEDKREKEEDKREKDEDKKKKDEDKKKKDEDKKKKEEDKRKKAEETILSTVYKKRIIISVLSKKPISKSKEDLMKTEKRDSNTVSADQPINVSLTEDTVISAKPKHNTRRSVVLQSQVTESRANLKRPWSVVEQDKTVPKQTTKTNKRITKMKKFRDSTDDFVLSPHPIKKMTSKSRVSVANNELVIVGLDPEEGSAMKALCSKLAHKYSWVDIIRTKEQLIVVPDKPKRSMDLIKALIHGNTFVSLIWLHDSLAQKKWLDHTRYIVAYTDIVQISSSTDMSTAHLFKEHTSMYISTSAHSLPKYKLRLLIEQSGGTVTDSFRQAGIVIDTRKVNALSVTSAWILDCIKQGTIIDEHDYLIT